MKTRFLLMILLLFTNSMVAFSQDILVKKNGDEIKAKVIEVSSDQVKYKKWENLNGPDYSESLSKIFMIKYQNGTKDVFNQQEKIVNDPNVAEEERKSQAVQRIRKFFDDGFNTAKLRTYKLLDFKKINGVMRNFNGQFVYEVDFEMKVQLLISGYKKGNGMVGYWSNFVIYEQKPDLYASNEAFIYSLKYYPAGSTFIFRGAVNMASSDNGYQFQDYKINNVTELGVRPQQESLQLSNSSNLTLGASSIPEVDYKIFSGTLITDGEGHAFKVTKIQVDDASIPRNAVNVGFITLLEKMKALHVPVSKTIDTLGLSAELRFSIRNYSTTAKLNFFADCLISFSVTNLKTSKIIANNTYKITNYSLLNPSFNSANEAETSLIKTGLAAPLYNFLLASLPISGNITEIIEQNKKGDEAKLVKVNIGSTRGVDPSCEFIISEINTDKSKADLSVKELHEDYCICKVKNNQKAILDYFNKARTLTIRTK